MMGPYKLHMQINAESFALIQLKLLGKKFGETTLLMESHKNLRCTTGRCLE